MEAHTEGMQKLEIQPDFLASLTTKRKSGEPRNEREDWMMKFLDAINPSRAAAGYKPFSYPHMARMLQHVPTEDLYAFFKDCERARTFSSYFHWALKVQRTPQA